jgi:hypothetical protein
MPSTGVRFSRPRGCRLALALLLAGAACSRTATDASRGVGLADDALPRQERLRDLMGALADDSTRGRRIGTPENAAVARFLAAELERYGVLPGADGSFLQPVPLARIERNGRTRLVLPSATLDFDTLPPDALVVGEANVVGVIPGSEPPGRAEAVVIGAHFDHVGVGRPVAGDSVYNGADDDASGTVAILEIARALAHGPALRRTVVVLLSTGEEAGLLGTSWYMDHPAAPLNRTVADFQIEMIGRPDSLVGGRGRAWLTGYERTTLGDLLADAPWEGSDASPIVPDPRPAQRFFFRSDNVPFAIAGIPAHTLSSYDLHEDYHQPSDEVDGIDFAHLEAVTDAALQAVRNLADGPKPEWKPGGREGLPVSRR